MYYLVGTYVVVDSEGEVLAARVGACALTGGRAAHETVRLYYATTRAVLRLDTVRIRFRSLESPSLAGFRDRADDVTAPLLRHLKQRGVVPAEAFTFRVVAPVRVGLVGFVAVPPLAAERQDRRRITREEVWGAAPPTIQH